MSTEPQPPESGTDEAAEPTDKPDITDEHRERAKEMSQDNYDRPTVTMPGSGGTVSGTAVNDWLDDDGNPKFSSEKPTES